MADMPAKLALEDGTVFTGRSFGVSGETDGEVVFNTSMTGYQEVLTDPSYHGQIVTMTYPLIGNYGLNLDDRESGKPQVQGLVVREATRIPSNFRSEASLHEYFEQYNLMGIEGIDTRALVRQIRIQGAMKGVLSTVDLDNVSLVRKARQSKDIVGRDLVSEVVPEANFTWSSGFTHPLVTYLPAQEASHHVVAMDFGMKENILRCLVQVGCRVTVVPGTAKANDILDLDPDGVFLSNGPGDPSAVSYAIETIHSLLGKKPIFGICLGHQLLALAHGADTFKLKFGHRGANQPVLNNQTQRVEITTQNHGFAVKMETLPKELEATHINLNDQTLEGLRHRTQPMFSVQYHPEASAGPHDSSYLFEEFRRLMG